MSAQNIFIICGDPGGANAVAPVIKLLREEKRVKIIAYAYRHAITIWKKMKLDYSPIFEINTEKVFQLLKENNTKLLLTGTSVNPVELEKRFISAANTIGIPTLAILDYWSHYRARFSNGKGLLSFLPDIIAVMDELARDEMISEGFDPNKIVITGQPSLDDLLVYKKNYSPVKGREIRNTLGIGCFEKIVLFVSQPFVDKICSDVRKPEELGFTEKSILKSLIKALENVSIRTDKKIVLIVRPHPREKIEDFICYKSDYFRIIVSSEQEARDMVMASDIVLGINTILLFESCYLGQVTVSVQPGQENSDVLPTNGMGLSIPIYHEEDMERVLEKLLKEKDLNSFNRKRELKFPRNATRRIVALAYEMMGI